jgi:hypothetical protein
MAIGYSYQAALSAFAIAIFSLFGRRAMETWEKRKFREVAISVFLAILPIELATTVLLPAWNVSMMVQNFALGTIGAMVGAAFSVWAGYVTRDIVTGAQPAQSTGASVSTNRDKPPPMNISGDNNVVSIGQTGGVTAGTYVNQVPQPKLQLIDQNDQLNSHNNFYRRGRIAAHAIVSGDQYFGSGNIEC